MSIFQLYSPTFSKNAVKFPSKKFKKRREFYGKEDLNLTCKQYLHYEDYQMSTIKKMLEEKLYQLSLEDEDDKVNQ
ncbi:hypothetical protein HY792_05290 [Candidatus Desantisbacteria bacterium]|nr:hypothetical protein [Candidatus Desantisbacteria bacterium]